MLHCRVSELILITFNNCAVCYLAASHSFPYIKKRIIVVYHKEEELSPIEVAVEDMKAKVAELTEVVCQRVPDIKKLQLKLSGALSVQVHAGPLAYAEVFLTKQTMHKWHHNKIGALKEYFRYVTSRRYVSLSVCTKK